jgi:hypothetical protein
MNRSIHVDDWNRETLVCFDTSQSLFLLFMYLYRYGDKKIDFRLGGQV